MFWSNVFVWDGKTEGLQELAQKVYRPTIRLLREDRMRQATVALASELVERLDQKSTRDVISELRDLTVLHQVDIATLQKDDLDSNVLPELLNSEKKCLTDLLGEDATPRGHVALAEKNPFELVSAFHRLGYRWVLLDAVNVLGPYIDLMDDTIYELGISGSVYAIFPNRTATRILRGAQITTSRQFQKQFTTKLNRKFYLVSVLTEEDLSSTDDRSYKLLDDIYSDLSVRSWRVGALEELFQKRTRLEVPV